MHKDHVHIFYYSLFISLVISLVSGFFSSLFLYSLDWITLFRNQNLFILGGLPLFGFCLGLILYKCPPSINQGIPSLLNKNIKNKNLISPWTSPFIFLSSLGTHLFGGSAGREGVGILMGVGVSQILPKLNNKFSNSQHYLIYFGIAAGFSSIFGTPIGAVVFTFELFKFKEIKNKFLVIMTVFTSFMAYFVGHLLGPSHQSFSVSFDWNKSLLIYIGLIGFISGTGALIYYWGYQNCEKLLHQMLPKIYLRLPIVGIFISLFVFTTQSYSALGIGTDIISQSFLQKMHFSDFGFKCILTILTLSAGFKGGEATPLFFMGSVLSNYILSIFNFNNFALSSSLGMVSLFGAVTATPLASIFIAYELFGLPIGLFSIIPCFLARKLMGKNSIYKI